MNYRHIYHAGNFADLMKHLILVALLKKLQEKDKGFTVLDAFAGIGLYDLESEEAQKTKEYENGIGVLRKWVENHHPRGHKVELRDLPSSSSPRSGARGSQDTREELLLPHEIPDPASRSYAGTEDDAISTYLSLAPSPTLYPGSPYIIASLLRGQDNLIASELHPQDYATLKHNMRMCDAAIHHIDGYNAIKAFLPPKSPRGLVLLDGAFEVRNEYLKIIDALKLIRKRFAAGIVMIWYPIKDVKLVKEFYKDLKGTGYPEFLRVEFEIDDIGLGMNKCGVIIANPPHIKTELEEMMRFLCDDVYGGGARVSVGV